MSFSRASREIHLFFNSYSILHQLNTKSNSIKSHKIQGTKLKQLQHFLSRVFLSEWPLILLWVMRVYIVWVKGKKVILKNPLGRMFLGYLVRSPYARDTREILQVGMTFQLPVCASHVALSWVGFSWASREIHLFFNLYSIIHQLNTKSNTIKSHKIQGKKLKQLQHFLSWNKANIKYSCKLQLYRNYSILIVDLKIFIFEYCTSSWREINIISCFIYNNLTLEYKHTLKMSP